MEKTIFATYINQIQRYPLLNAEQERELSLRVQRGDTAAKMSLVNSNLRLVVSVARKYVSDKNLLMDLIQEGNLGLMTAAGKFSASFNVRFSTYAYPWISQYMLRYLNNKQPSISIPYRKAELLRSMKRAEAMLTQKLGHEPSIKELAVYMGVPEKSLLDVQGVDYTCTSLDSEIVGTEGLSYGAVLPDERQCLEQNYMEKVKASEIRGLLSFLSWKERQVIYYRYNLCCDGKPKTLRQVGQLLGCSTESVRQVELRALSRLRKAAAQFSV